MFLLPSATTRTGILSHVSDQSGPEIFRFGLWMTLVAYVVVLVALPDWSVVGEPLVVQSRG